MTRLDFLCPQIILKLLPCPKYINQFSLAQLSSISDFDSGEVFNLFICRKYFNKRVALWCRADSKSVPGSLAGAVSMG
jgi:hypothetical protein